MFKLKNNFEICFYGRAGQGAKTAADLIARTAISEGKYAQAFSEFTSERYGAPVKSFVRISEKPITIHTEIIEPDIIVIIDSTLDTEQFKKGILIINSNNPNLKNKIKFKGKIILTDASKISFEVFKKNFPNAPLLAILQKNTNLVSKEDLKKIIFDHFKEHTGEEIANLNLKAFEEAYKK